MNILALLKMKKDVVYVKDNCRLSKAIALCQENGYTAVPVLDEGGKYIGTVNEGDFLRATYGVDLLEISQKRVSEIIRPSFNPSLRVDATMDELLRGIMEQNFVPIVDDRGVFMGIITRKSVIKTLQKEAR